MKKVLLIILCVLTSMILFSCKDGDDVKKNSETTSEKTISVTFVNDVEEADIWIMPHTQENLKTSLWGTATISKLNAGEKQTVSIGESEDEKYIVRIIDKDKAYYSASEMILETGYTVQFKTDDSKYEAAIVSLDQNGKEIASKKAFQGVFGAN